MYGVSPIRQDVDWNENFIPDGSFATPNAISVVKRLGRSGHSNLNKKEVFYSIKDGLANDPSVWNTSSGKVGLIPSVNDDIYIYHTLNFSSISNTIDWVVNNVFVSKEGMMTSQFGFKMYVHGSIKCRGTINAFNSHLFLYSDENYINNYDTNSGTQGTIYYMGELNQRIISLNYHNLHIGSQTFNHPLTGSLEVSSAASIKRLSSHTTLTGNLVVGYAKFDTYGYDLTVNGTTGLNGPNAANGEWNFEATGFSNILFIGELRVTAVGFNFAFDLRAGNPNVECRGGIDLYRITSGFFPGSGAWTFTTNNQTIRSTAGATANVTFISNVTISNVDLIVDTGVVVNLTSPINATNAGNTLTNKGTINFLTAASIDSMTTGIFDITSFTNTVGYTGNYTSSLRSGTSTYHNLAVTGTGTKTAISDVTCNGTLFVAGGGTSILQIDTYNLSVIGTTTVQNGARLNKSGAGSLLFVGNVIIDNAFFNWSGNPTVEMRGGMTAVNVSAANSDTGTGLWSFTTNSQSVTGTNNSTLFRGQISIVGAITISFTGGASGIGFADTVNGTNASSKLENKGRFDFTTATAATTCMSTGILDISTFANTVGFSGAYSVTIPYTSFRSLAISGASGTKTLSGNTTVSDNYSGIGSGTFECSSFDLTVTGTTLVGQLTFSKNAAGSLLFVGLLTVNNASMILSGNPSVELRGGFTQITNPFATNYHSSVWTFTTNNQNINLISTAPLTQSFIISGAITVTSLITSTPVFQNTIDGNNANSVFSVLGSTYYRTAVAPMVTGKLYANQNSSNIFVYDGAFNQDITVPQDPSSPGYRNLTLAGSGAKRLLGNVSVKGTYTLTGPATLDSNGFSLTNP